MHPIVTRLVALAFMAAAALVMAPPAAEAGPVPTSAVPHLAPDEALVHPAQYYYGRPRYYGPRYYRPYYGPRYYGRRYYGPRFYGRPGYYGRGYYGRGYRRW